MQTRKLS